MRKIPLRPEPSQSCSVVLGGQNCQISVYQKEQGLFLDLMVNHAPIAMAVVCRDRVRLVREEYSTFVGDLVFVDSFGLSDPNYKGLGSRFILAYLEATEL